MVDFTKYADCFYGNGETDRFISNGLASKWFYIKAQCGNTFAHATLPFGKISVGPYSGGYPTGYGTHYPNSCGGIKKLGEVATVRGFSHLHHSGVGGIGYYYNYAIVTPFEGGINDIYEYSEISRENARPGHYGCNFNGIDCEFTVCGGVAIHKYSLNGSGGKIAVDFSNNGLSKAFSPRFYSTVEKPVITVLRDDTLAFEGEFCGVKLYFAVKVSGEKVKSRIFVDGEIMNESVCKVLTFRKGYGGVFDFSGSEALVKVAYSTISVENAIAEVNDCNISFDEAVDKARAVWNDALGKIEVETDDEQLKEKFYSNLYHTLVKPSVLGDERIFGAYGDIVTDISTFWDIYKTVLPLQLLLYKDFGEKMVSTIAETSEVYGKVPCSLSLTNIFNCEEQAKMLSVYTLLDAYRYGVSNATLELVEQVFNKELERADYEKFLQTGYFDRYTHILDVTDACLNIAEVTKDEQLKKRAIELSKFWINAYDSDGLMSKNSPYYEGDRYTYSFRLQKNIDERIELAGGKEKYETLLDDFFGFNGESVSQVREVEAYEEIESKQYHRFQGFNNECDMETPYSYIFAGNHDKLCDIARECVNKSFGLGKSGLPGNNDSGGLSSCFIWNALGLFPISGSGRFLVGAPSFKKVTITMFNGNKLTVVAENFTPYGYVDSVSFNGEEISDYSLETEKIVNGGTLIFKMR